MIGKLTRGLFLATLFCTLLPLSIARETIDAGRSINGTETLISTQGSFQLGLFFTPRRSKHRYLGIWYNRIPGPTVVWVANRQSPVPDSATALLTVSGNGSLILADTTGAVYWSWVPTRAVSNPAARLLDDGNFVLLDAGGSNTGNYAWQSFDHPADTMLPGMKLGSDLSTGLNRILTAWKSDDDPAPSGYSFLLDQRGDPQIFLMNGSAPRWRSGPWVGERYSGIPEMKANGMFTYGFYSDRDGVYFKFDMWKTSLLSRIVMNQSGSVQHLLWNEGSGSWDVLWFAPVDRCDNIGACGPNGICQVNTSAACECVPGFQPRRPQDWDRGVTAGGCGRKTALDCRRGTSTDGFAPVSGAKLPDTSGARVNKSFGSDECRAACRDDCSCTGFASGDGSGCVLWLGELNDLRSYSSGGQDLYVRVASADLASGDDSNQKKKTTTKRIRTIIITVLTIVPVTLLLTWLVFRRRRRRRARKRSLEGTQSTIKDYHNNESERGNDLELPLFHLSTIEAATNSFSLANKLGEGGFGPVYKGILHEGLDIAVKRLSKSSGQGLEEFKSEIQLVAKLQHTNLVRLLGCCIEGEEKILIYEYMPNQSLDKFIFGPNSGVQLDWAKRLHIIEGITQGLLYLHKYSRLRVIHRDLKASNILLDAEWNPKISDFGLARIFSWNESQANTRRIIGTYGYMPPEYAMKGLFSVKSDVFSFGILLLEILSGKKNTSIKHFGLSRNLPGYAWELWREGRELELTDPTLGGTCPNYELSRCVHVALLCVQDNPGDRPTMSDVDSMLRSETASLPRPDKPAFFFGRNVTREDVNFEIDGQSSTNDVTISQIEGR